MERLIVGFFTHLNLVLLILPFVVAGLSIGLRKQPVWEELFRWNALIGVGAGFMYAFIIHGFFPAMSARSLGWEVSPFQWEVAVANFSVGMLGILAFRASYGFRLATVVALTCWMWGAAIGHIRQMVVAGNFNPGNAGLWFWLDVLMPLLFMFLIIMLKKKTPQT